MKTFIIILLTLFSATSMLRAQEIIPKQKIHAMLCGGLTVGYGNMNVSKLKIFVPEGMDQFNKHHLLLGGAIHEIVTDFVIGASYFVIVGSVVENDNNMISLGGGIGTIDFGYNVLNKRRIKIFPMLGIGGGRYGLLITKQASNDPGQEIKINQGIADVSLNINLLSFTEYDPNENFNDGLMTRLKIGYMYGLPSSNWHITGNPIPARPEFGINMFYINLIIGGFGYAH